GEEGDADRLVLNRTRIIAPGGDAAPTLLLANLTLRVGDTPFAVPGGHAVGHAHGEATLTCVAEGDRRHAGVQVDIEDKQPSRFIIDEQNFARFVQDLVAVGGAPFVARCHPGAVLIGLIVADAHADDAAAVGRLGPEIDAFNTLDLALQAHALRDDVAEA